MTKLTYTGQDIEISYDVKRCIHAAKCVEEFKTKTWRNGKYKKK